MRWVGLTFLLAAGFATRAAETVFLETDGRIAMEVESFPVAGDWKAEKDLVGFSGDSYYTWRSSAKMSRAGQGILTFRILVTNPGKHHLRIHNRHDFADSTEENDCFMKLDDGPWVKTFSHKRGEWTWATNHEFDHARKPPAEYELSAGLHTLQLAGRSKGFSIDRIHLYRDGVKDGTDLKAPVSPAAKPDAIQSALRTAPLPDAATKR